jgi:hypothetical protein
VSLKLGRSFKSHMPFFSADHIAHALTRLPPDLLGVPGPFWSALEGGALADGSNARFRVFLTDDDYPEQERAGHGPHSNAYERRALGGQELWIGSVSDYPSARLPAVTG